MERKNILIPQMMGYTVENNKWKAPAKGDPLFLNGYSPQSSHSWDLEMLMPPIAWINRQVERPVELGMVGDRARVIIPMLGTFHGRTFDEAAFDAVSAYARYHRSKLKAQA